MTNQSEEEALVEFLAWNSKATLLPAFESAFEDAIQFGAGWIRVNDDGICERVDPNYIIETGE